MPGEDFALDQIQEFIQAKLVGRGHVLYCADVCKENAWTFPEDCCSQEPSFSKQNHVGDVQMTARRLSSLSDIVFSLFYGRKRTSVFKATCLIFKYITSFP